jgi:hypothetical protein
MDYFAKSSDVQDDIQTLAVTTTPISSGIFKVDPPSGIPRLRSLGKKKCLGKSEEGVSLRL